jgi:serine/threonine protein kinase
MPDLGADSPTEPTPTDSYPHIYVKDTDARFTTNNTLGFGRYADFQPLAAGGSALLRTCRDKNLGRTVVMKTLHPHLANNEYMHSRFIREARVTAQLQHPTTVPVYDIGHDLEGRLYFTMKKLEGLSGRQVLDGQIAGDKRLLGEFDLERILGVLVQIASGLAYAHAHGVVHRDVKPENIFVGEFGEATLLDWGVAKVWADTRAGDVDERMQHEVLTDANQRPGTPLYMSPEQVRGGGGEIDQRTDVYSLGAVLYEFLTLSEPIKGKRVQDTFKLIVEDMPESPRERAPNRQIPQALADVCLRAMAKRPEDRYQSMSDMIAAIREFRGQALRTASS